MKRQPSTSRLPAFATVLTASLATAFAALALAACGGGEAEREAAMVTAEPTRVVTVLPSPTAGPTDTPEPRLGASAPTTASAGAGVPLRPGEPVVQFARVETRRWEPELLEQITPNFSMQADGFIYFRQESGVSADGWYQTAVTPTSVTAFADRLINDIGVLELARTTPITPVFGTKADGTPEDTVAVGIVYVKTPTREGRLVIRQEDLDSPPTRNGEAIAKLATLLRAVQVWRQSAAQEFQPSEVEAMASVIGWWPLFNPVPYTPDAVTVFGTLASPDVPETLGPNELLEWPYLADVEGTPALSGTITAPYGFAPTKLSITSPVSGNQVDSGFVAALIRERRRLAPGAFWGPLWVDPAERQTRNEDGSLTPRHRFLVGVRPEVPNGNFVRLNYLFHPGYRVTQPR